MEKQGTMVDLDLIFDFEMVRFLNNHILYKTWIQNIAKFQNIQLRIQNGQWHWLCSISKIRRIQNRPLHFEMHNLLFWNCFSFQNSYVHFEMDSLLCGLSSTCYIFLVSNSICELFETLNSWLLELQNHMYLAL